MIRDVDGTVTVREIPASAFGRYDGPLPEAEKPVLPKLHAEIATAASKRPPGELVRVVITWHDELKLPVFRGLNRQLARESATNQAILRERREMADAIAEARRPVYDAREAEIVKRGGRVLERFWLIDGVEAEIPLAMVDELAADPKVNYVEPATQRARPAATISTGRAVINSNWWYNRLNIQASFPPIRPYNGWAPVQVGILDTGVRTSHTLFSGAGIWTPAKYGRIVDCDYGTSTPCLTAAQGGNPFDDYSTDGHGTGVASIIAANSTLGDANRGVAPYTFESFKVCCSGGGGGGPATFTRAFQEAALTNDVISVSMSYGVTFNDAVALAADAAYDTGRMVVAAVGNVEGGDYTPTSPGNAHKVIGVGAVLADNPSWTVYQRNGPTLDGRFKPDVQGPTDVSAASRTSNTAMWTYGGTSGATPFISAAAALTLNTFCDVKHCYAYYVGGSQPTSNVGEVYAAMIRRGDNWYGPFGVKGSGVLRMDGEYGTQSFGNVTLSPGQTVDVDVVTTTNAHHDGSIGVWWPESYSQAHNNVYAYLRRPNNTTAVAATLNNTVWQKIYYPGDMTVGTWKLRLLNLGSTSQKVFWNYMIKCDVPSYCGSF